MQTISYKRDTMLGQAIGCLMLAAGGAWLAFQPHFGFKFRFIGGFVALCLPVVSAALFNRWRGDGVALRFDARTLSISTFYRTGNFTWRDVRNIQRERLTQSSGFGLIKQNLAHYLVITVALEDGFERSFRLQEELLNWPRDAMDALADELAGLWAQGLATKPGASPPPVAPSPVPTINGRLLPAAANRPSFGRRTA